MANPFQIHPRYRHAAEALLSNAVHEEKFRSTTPSAINATIDGVSLWVVVNTQDSIIKAEHFGAEGAERAILEGLCQLSVGRTVRELSEHGLIYLEHQMRDPKVPHEVKGLLTPENADPSFQLPLRLVRSLFKQSGKSSQVPQTKNFWTPNPSKIWASLSEQEQRGKIEIALKEVSLRLNLTNCRIEIIEIRHHTRLVVSVSGYQGETPIGSVLMTIENLLKKRLEPQLELILESLEDRNKRVGRTQIPRSVEAST